MPKAQQAGTDLHHSNRRPSCHWAACSLGRGPRIRAPQARAQTWSGEVPSHGPPEPRRAQQSRWWCELAEAPSPPAVPVPAKAAQKHLRTVSSPPAGLHVQRAASGPSRLVTYAAKGCKLRGAHCRPLQRCKGTAKPTVWPAHLDGSPRAGSAVLGTTFTSSCRWWWACRTVMATRPFWRSTVPGRFMLTVPASSSSAVCSVHSPAGSKLCAGRKAPPCRSPDALCKEPLHAPTLAAQLPSKGSGLAAGAGVLRCSHQERLRARGPSAHELPGTSLRNWLSVKQRCAGGLRGCRGGSCHVSSAST